MADMSLGSVTMGTLTSSVMASATDVAPIIVTVATPVMTGTSTGPPLASSPPAVARKSRSSGKAKAGRQQQLSSPTTPRQKKKKSTTNKRRRSVSPTARHDTRSVSSLTLGCQASAPVVISKSKKQKAFVAKRSSSMSTVVQSEGIEMPSSTPVSRPPSTLSASASSNPQLPLLLRLPFTDLCNRVRHAAARNSPPTPAMRQNLDITFYHYGSARCWDRLMSCRSPVRVENVG